ncbi:MAG: DUF6734 family protein, partial [Coprococcus sp.]
MGIKGFHTIWSKPYMTNNNTNEYFLQDYEILTMMMSALMWRKQNGSICLYGDKIALDYIDKTGISHIWDDGMKEINVSDKVPAKVFWAAGKLYAMKQMVMPAVMIDLDLIIWRDVRRYIENADICAIHREGIFPDVYPDKEFFNMDQDYRFDPEWNWKAFPVNTCMLYIADDEFKRYYVESAVDFMEHCREKEENLCHMVFAEQRMLAMCAEKQGRIISSFFPAAMDIERQDIFTHLWGYKNILKFNYEERVRFNNKMCNRIIEEFPEEEPVLAKLDI